MSKPKRSLIEKISYKAINWIGTPNSILIHTIFFLGSFVLILFGVPYQSVLLVLTTIVSLEAIYLSLFIQMSVMRQQKHIKEVAQDVDEILEDTEELTEEDKAG